MKLHRNTSTYSRAGIMLMECLVYMTLLFVVLGMAYMTFYQGWDNSLSFQRNAAQISRSLIAGERWREDVRAATGPLRAEASAGEETLHIPQGNREVLYRVEQDRILRGDKNGASWVTVLDRVKSSQMQSDPRQKVTAWRWELELKTKEKTRRIQPLLTFEAVPNLNNPAQ